MSFELAYVQLSSRLSHPASASQYLRLGNGYGHHQFQDFGLLPDLVEQLFGSDDLQGRLTGAPVYPDFRPLSLFAPTMYAAAFEDSSKRSHARHAG